MGVLDTIAHAMLVAIAVNFLHLFRAKPARQKVHKAPFDR
jgi:hypothetical protein